MGGKGSGGYKQPMNPAPVSGPGALSKRTDGGATEGMTQPVRAYTGGAYGMNKELRDQQAGAPMAGNPIFNGLSLADFNPSDKPMTYGIDTGDGPGSEIFANRTSVKPTAIDTLRQLVQFDPTGEVELILSQMS